MNYSKSYFDKDIDVLEYADIENYFLVEREESNKIEFKSYSREHGKLNKNLDGVIRGICAFLNSDGGILIWGAPKGHEKEGRKEKVFSGDLSPVPEFLEKDWLINKVSDSISPLPVGVRVEPLQKGDTYLYIFEVQKSIYSPHQFKNIYYARLDGQTKPAPHYLIDALFNKVSYPNIEGYFKPVKIKEEDNNYLLYFKVMIFNFSELKNEERLLFRLVSSIGVFPYSRDPRAKDMYFGENELRYKHDILHFGGPLNHSDVLEFDKSELAKHDFKVSLSLVFGGKHSPLKSSDYVLNLKGKRVGNEVNYNYLIVSMEENILMSEQQQKKDMKKNDIIKRHLER